MAQGVKTTKLFTKQQMIDALHKAEGNTSRCARILRISQPTAYYHITSDPDLKAIVDMYRGARDDVEGSKHDENIHKKRDSTRESISLKASMYWLDRKGAALGYTAPVKGDSTALQDEVYGGYLNLIRDMRAQLGVAPGSQDAESPLDHTQS